MKYFKILNKEEIQHGLQYKTGIVEDYVDFDDGGGLHFTTSEHICEFLSKARNGGFIREVGIPRDARVAVHGNGLRSSKLYIKRRYVITELDTWKYLIDCGVDIHKDDLLLDWACKHGYIDLVKFIVNDIINNQYVWSNDTLNAAIYIAAKSWNIDIVKFLSEAGAEISYKVLYAAFHDFRRKESSKIRFVAELLSMCNTIKDVEVNVIKHNYGVDSVLKSIVESHMIDVVKTLELALSEPVITLGVYRGKYFIAKSLQYNENDSSLEMRNRREIIDYLMNIYEPYKQWLIAV